MKKILKHKKILIIGIGLLLSLISIQGQFTESSGSVVSKSSIQKSTVLPEEYPVQSVVDGDTIKVIIKGKKTTVRILGIDTPELFPTRTGYQECFGVESSAFAKRSLSGALVRLETDTTQDAKDKYGRILAHVFFSGGLLYQEESIKNGYGFRYVYKTPTKYDARLKQAENEAKAKKLGVWEKCDGVRKPIAK